SNPGASLLVSAPSNGGTKGITTTDLPGSAGYAAGSVTTTFGGTSAAAPQVTGTVALMLEANPNLGWRDVRTILAMSAEQPTAIATVTN
ncbi:S8 family serine peptidase, partial [Escherichia coli]|uniref:S8 family serine peptidase n=8 Tax=Pseudomonadota TaxID=1224 RepID=UPI0013D224B8